MRQTASLYNGVVRGRDMRLMFSNASVYLFKPDIQNSERCAFYSHQTDVHFINSVCFYFYYDELKRSVLDRKAVATSMSELQKLVSIP